DYGSGRRQVWFHKFETLIFTPEEIESMSVVKRRPIYMATLEAHIEILLQQLGDMGVAVVSPEELDVYHGLSRVLAKAMICGLQDDIVRLEHELAMLDREV
ncbi:hypothetical protein C8Q76DRAFT_576397, partial [Earliella scabrosa]